MATPLLWFQLSPFSNPFFLSFYLSFLRLRSLQPSALTRAPHHPHLWPVLCFQLFTQSLRWWDSGQARISRLCRLGVNDPPTAVGGIRDGRASVVFVGRV